MLIRAFGLAFALVLAHPVAAQTPCHGDVACPLGDRSYHVLEPDGWDGTTPLPVLLHFHGWQRQGDLIVRHDRIARHTRLRGVLLVAPNGERRTWRFRTAASPDVAFADAVLTDLAARYPIDPDRIYVSGYSFGGAMAWRFVCQSGDDIAGLFGIAGTIHQSETCPEAPREVRHVHGLDDTVMDFPFGPDGDTTHPVSLWRTQFGCGAGQDLGQWNLVSFLTFTRTEWTDCETGYIALDLHPGGTSSRTAGSVGNLTRSWAAHRPTPDDPDCSRRGGFTSIIGTQSKWNVPMIRTTLAALALLTAPAFADEVWQTETGAIIYEADLGHVAVLSFPSDVIPGGIVAQSERARAYFPGLGGNFDNRSTHTGYWVATGTPTCTATLTTLEAISTQTWGRVTVVFDGPAFPTSFTMYVGTCWDEPMIEMRGLTQ